MEKEYKDLQKLIEYLQQQNRSKSALESLTKKSNQDSNEQLENIASLLARIERAITGIKVDFDLKPVTGVLEKHTELLKSISEEQVLLRKIGEGSLEYDKKMGAYRNTSGRDVVNKVSGKTAGKSGIVDYETARDPLAGQSKAVIERVTNNKSTTSTNTTNNTNSTSTTTNTNTTQAAEEISSPIPDLKPIPEKYVPGENSELDKSIKVLIETLKVTPKKLGLELAKSLSSYKVPEEQKTTTEKLKEVVSIYKRMGAAVLKGPKALASGVDEIVKTGKSAFTDPKAFKEKLTSTKESLKEKSKEAFNKVSDIAGAETDYTVERERFAKEYAKQNLERTDTTKSEKELIEEGKEKYNKVTSKEGELSTAQGQAKETVAQGFTPVKSDIEKIVQLKDELKDLKTSLVTKEKEATSNEKTDTDNTTEVKSSTSEVKSSTDKNTETSSVSTTTNNTSSEKEISDKNSATTKEVKVTENLNKEIETLTTNIQKLEIKPEESVQAVEPVQAKQLELPKTAANDAILESKESSTEQKFQQSIKQILAQQKKDSDKPVNEESDNIQSAQEILADNSKEDLELSKKSFEIIKQQLDELKQIREALAPKIPKELEAAAKTSEVPSKDEEGGLGLGIDLGLGKKALGALGRGAKVVGRGALSIGGKLARFAGSKAGRVGGAALAIGAGAYTAYKGYTGAEEEKQQELEAIDEKVKSGELTPDKAEAAKKEVEAKTTENKGGAIGEGTGMAAGAIGGGIAGAKVGAAIGTFFGGPVGTAVGAGIGTLAGGAIGAISGSSVGKNIGGLVGKGVAGIKSFFGGSEDKSKRISSGTITSENTIDEETFSKNDSESYKKFVEFREQRVNALTEELQKKNKVSELSEQDKKTVIQQAQLEAVTKFSKEIEAAKASKPGTKSNASTDQLPSAAKSAEPVTGKSDRLTSKTNALKAEATRLGIDPSNAKGTFEGGVLTKVTDDSTGQVHEVQIKEEDQKRVEAARNMRAMNQRSGDLARAQSPNTGLSVAKESTENTDLNREVNNKPTSLPPIISNNVSNNNNTSFVPIKPSVRPENMGSALDRYQSRVSSY